MKKPSKTKPPVAPARPLTRDQLADVTGGGQTWTEGGKTFSDDWAR